MAEQRLIDANKILYHQAWESGSMEPANEGVALMSEVQAMPTIDPETLPVVRQLREELALITHQRDVYKSVFERITAHGDCNDCGKVKECQFAPKCGEDTRYNCPLWSGSQKEE